MIKEQDKLYMKKELKKFVESMNEYYEKENLIKNFCTINEFIRNGMEFFQIGERINISKEAFLEEEGISKDNTTLAGDFIRSLVNGEKDFVLNEIVNSGKIRKFKIPKFDYVELCKIISNLANPTDIFFPLEPFFKEINLMSYENKNNLKFVMGFGPILIINGKEIKIDWITSHEKIDKIIVINKSELKITQKKFDNSETPKWMKVIKEYEEFNIGKKLMTSFGEKNDKEFDFVFRTILSKPELNQDSAIVIEAPN
jgi:hypothetical protein